VHALEWIAERRLEEAAARGEFQGLPGEGRPLDLEDEDPLLAPEVRMAKRILKNAGLDLAEVFGGLREELAAAPSRASREARDRPSWRSR
jgi:hypothetical protein